jgi:hypothetical protein
MLYFETQVRISLLGMRILEFQVWLDTRVFEYDQTWYMTCFHIAAS